MDWKKIGANLTVVSAGCFSAHYLMAGGLRAALTLENGVSIALCLGANLLGLFQRPPQTTPTRPPAAAAAR